MPIYDQSYAHWEGRLEGRFFRWLPITTAGIRQAFKSKKFLTFFILCFIPFLIRLTMILIFNWVTAAQGDAQLANMARVDGEFFHNFLIKNQIYSIVVICLFVGIRLIAQDMKAGALEVYFSKPLLLMDYIIGKFMVIAFFLACMTLFPSLFLFFTDVFLSDEPGYFKEALVHLPGILIISFLLIGVNSLVVMACSSMVRTTRNAGILWFGFYMALLGVTEIIAEIFSNVNVQVFNIPYSLSFLSEILFKCEESYGWPFSVPLSYLLFIMLSAFGILLLRIRGAEVVKS